MSHYFERTDNKTLDELEGLLIKFNVLFEAAEEDSDKTKLLSTIGDLEEKIRSAEYKERLINGEE